MKTHLLESAVEEVADACTGRCAQAAARRSAELFDNGLYCAESVLKAVAETCGPWDPMLERVIPKIATGFCGGVSRTSGLCGALSGGIMALGLLTGRSKPADAKHECYALVHHFVQCFREQFGSTDCSQLLGCDLSTPEGSLFFKNSDLEATVCATITRRAAALAADIYGRRGSIRHPLL